METLTQIFADRLWLFVMCGILGIVFAITQDIIKRNKNTPQNDLPPEDNFNEVLGENLNDAIMTLDAVLEKNTMQYFIKQHVLEFYKAIELLDGDYCEFIFEPPCSEKKINDIESELGHDIPKGLKDFALNISRRIVFTWMLPDNFELPESLQGIFIGGLDFDISAIPKHEKGRVGWVKECFTNPDDSYDVIWHNKIAFHHVVNGDYLAFNSSGQVVYLSHDDGDGHGYIMANSFSDLIRNWLPLGCPGPEDGQWIPFVSSCNSGLSPDCDTAKEWLKIIKKNS